MILRRTTLPFLAMALAVGALIVPAGAIHLFPLAPGDPGGDCGTTLEPDPGGSATTVSVALFDFTDDNTGTATSRVKAGESITWHWDLPHCHSVTFDSQEVPSTDGKQPGGFDGGEPQLVKPEGKRNTFSVTFNKPGTYTYSCVHHASMGMTGSIFVS